MTHHSCLFQSCALEQVCMRQDLLSRNLNLVLLTSGLSDEARADFRVMKDLGEHTRIAPEVRRKRFLDFIRDMKK
jgi:hypothetical protein